MENFLKEFSEEGKTHLEKIEKGLLLFEKEENHTNTINEMFRAIHSIKGTASFFSLKKIVELSHSIESFFGDVRSGKAALSSREIDVFLSAADRLRYMFADIENTKDADVSDLIDVISTLNRKISPESEQPVTAKADNALDKEMLQKFLSHGHKIYELRISTDNPPLIDVTLAKINNIGKVIDNNGTRIVFSTVLEKGLISMALDMGELEISELTFEKKEKKEKQKKLEQTEKLEKLEKPEQLKTNKTGVTRGTTSSNPDDSVRINILLLNELLSLSGEMVLARNQLLRTLSNRADRVSGLDGILQNIDRITSMLQEKIMQTRMQPISSLFERFPRIIREMSRKLGKEVILEISGGEIELDRSIIEALTDPLTHLLRNAVDHGMENPNEREAAGKNRTGRVSIKVAQIGGRVTIEIRDDGRGMDIEKIKKKATERGFISHNDIRVMKDKDILQIIFYPGFSTAENVTELSGRGVGMDVVKNNLEKMGGSVGVSTKTGKGTTFHLNLPISIAILSSLVVNAGGMSFAVPQSSIKEIVRVKNSEEKNRIETVENIKMLRLREELIPLVDLCKVLGIEGKDNGVKRILILNLPSRPFGLVVSEIEYVEAILVKPLPVYLKNCRTYSGVTLLGSGDIALILDIEGIADKAELIDYMESAGVTIGNAEDRGISFDQQTLLLFQCSGPEIFGLDLALISRVQRINREQIEKIGNKEYIIYRDASMRLLRLGDYLPVAKPNEDDSEQLFVVMLKFPKFFRYPVGLIADKICDTVSARISFNPDEIRGKGVLGTAIIEGRIVVILDVFCLMEEAMPETKDQTLKTKRVKILLVEDTPFFLKVEKGYLESAGFDVVTASNGVEAVNILKSDFVDVVVSDIEMPKMDGLELIRWIRTNEKHANIPAIAVTSASGPDKKREIIESGFDEYHQKLDKDELISALNKIMNSRRNEKIAQ